MLYHRKLGVYRIIGHTGKNGSQLDLGENVQKMWTWPTRQAATSLFRKVENQELSLKLPTSRTPSCSYSPEIRQPLDLATFFSTSTEWLDTHVLLQKTPLLHSNACQEKQQKKEKKKKVSISLLPSNLVHLISRI